MTTAAKFNSRRSESSTRSTVNSSGTAAAAELGVAILSTSLCAFSLDAAQPRAGSGLQPLRAGLALNPVVGLRLTLQLCREPSGGNISLRSWSGPGFHPQPPAFV